MISRIISILLLLMTSFRSSSQYAATENIKLVWENILDLKLDLGLTHLDAEKQLHPGNPLTIYYHHYISFLHTLASADVPGYEEFNRKSDSLIGVLRDYDPHHAEYLHLLSSMHLQKAFINIYFGNQWQGIRNLYTAYRMAGKNSVNYPGYIPNLKIEGIIDLLVSSVPESYKWLFNWLGMRADLREAAGKLERYYSTCSDDKRPEALIILSLAYGQIMQDKEKAYRLLKESEKSNMNRNITKPFMAFYASAAGHTSEAVSILEQNLLTDKVWDTQAILLLGLTKLNRLDSDAGKYLEDFVGRYKGSNHIRTAYHKLSWYYLIRGDTAQYIQYRQMVLSGGAGYLASDKQAAAEASDPEFPNVYLLKARLLYDAGMYERSLEILEDVSINELDTERQRLEYSYRLARVCHSLGMTERAKELYQVVITAGRDHRTYFAPYSALMMGTIAEGEGWYEEAGRFYETCLEINRGQYRHGIEREARIRLERLKDH